MKIPLFSSGRIGPGQHVDEDGTEDGPDQRGSDLFETQEAVDLYTARLRRSSLFPQERTAIERYFADSGSSILDIGCGVGRVSRHLHERGFDVTGIDVSEPLVERARSLVPGVDFSVEDIRDTSFEAESFQYAVFSFYGIDYLLPKAERKAALREIFRLLKPGGILVFSSHNSWHPFVPLSVRNLGFVVKDVFDLYLRKKNRGRIGSRYKFESVPLGEIEIYLSNPVHQWIQLRRCGFTPLDVIGVRDDRLRFFERDPHYVAKK